MMQPVVRPFIAKMSAMEYRTFLGSPLGWAVTLVLAAVGGYLAWNHSGHLLYALPYLLLLACPLMHLFGHRHRPHHRQLKEDQS